MQFIHSVLRPYQKDTLEKIQQSKKKYIILQAPTGSGKSFFPAQLAAWDHKVLALVRTKSLQQQYVNSYNFVELYGKGNYDCLGQLQDSFFDDTELLTADLCTLNCPGTCPYPLAKQDFLDSTGGTLNYTKFLLDRPVVDKFRPEYLFLDEAHDLSDLTVDFSGIVLNWKRKMLLKYTSPIEIDLPQPLAISAGKDYLSTLLKSLENQEPKHPAQGGDRREYKYWQHLKERLDITLGALEIEPEYWFVRADEKHLVCKPLTARYHFQALFNKAPKIIMMSATIGKIPYFVRELGITDFEYIEVPNVWPAPLRPIEDLQAPMMGFKSSTEDWQLHSQLIANKLNKCPEKWTGLIHTPSKRLAWDMAERIQKLTGRNIFVPNEEWGTEEAAKHWLQVENDGTICISWMFWEGIDSGKDNFCCVAKVPFIDFSQEFDKSRFMFDGKSGYSRIANKMVQGLGRIRRGHPEHYGNGNKVVCLADGHWTRLRNYISRDIMEAII